MFKELKVEIYIETTERFWKESDEKLQKVTERNESFHKGTNILKDF